MKSIRSLLALIVVSSMLFLGNTSAIAETKSLVVGSGPVGGGFNMVMAGISKYWKKDLGITTNITPGSMPGNLKKFAKGKLEIVMGASGWYNAMYEGNQLIFKEPAKFARIMFHVYDNPWYVIALKSSGMTKISDLKGKRYGGGPNKRIWASIMGNKLEANGIDYVKNNKVSIANFQDMAIMVSDGTIVACPSMLEGFTPQPATQRLMQEKELVALEWDPEVIKEFKNSMFNATVVRAGVVPFIKKDFHTFTGGAATFIARDDVDEKLIYNLTKTMHKNLKKMAAENPFWTYPAKVPEILTFDGGVPYHPGAIRYWKEVGMWNR